MSRRGLTDRVIVVLGGSGGIGAATARAAAEEGARVVVADVTPTHGPVDEPTIIADVTDEDSLTALHDYVVERYGHIDVVVNCAAVIEPGTIDATSTAAIRRQFHINVIGTAMVTRVFLPALLERGAGHLIHLGSLGGIVPLPNEAAYSATKFAVRGFCLAIAEELRGTGVEVTVVCPDSTDTGQLVNEAGNNGSPLSFMSRPLRPESVARSIVGAIRRPRREVCVPTRRGALAKLLGASPRLFAFAYPLIKVRGVKGRTRYLNQREPSTPQPVVVGEEVSS